LGAGFFLGGLSGLDLGLGPVLLTSSSIIYRPYLFSHPLTSSPLPFPQVNSSLGTHGAQMMTMPNSARPSVINWVPPGVTAGTPPAHPTSASNANANANANVNSNGNGNEASNNSGAAAAAASAQVSNAGGTNNSNNGNAPNGGGNATNVNANANGANAPSDSNPTNANAQTSSGGGGAYLPSNGVISPTSPLSPIGVMNGVPMRFPGGVNGMPLGVPGRALPLNGNGTGVN
jgi:hypothetical protein